MSTGRKDRKERLTANNSGVWASSSSDFTRAVRKIYVHSIEHAKSCNGNFSVYTLPAIPLVFSALRALLIECNTGMFGNQRDDAALEKLAKNSNELDFIKEHYDIAEQHLIDLAMLYEARNEIVHPAHTPTGTHHNTPKYLERLRELDLLEPGTWISQLQSHKLLVWSLKLNEEVVARILDKHHANPEQREFHMRTYTLYREHNL